jgi:RNA polymerase sigma factor (sigma-70 family)
MNSTTTTTNKIWTAYIEARLDADTPQSELRELRNRLFTEYQYLIKAEHRVLVGQLGKVAASDDIVSCGSIGLMLAIEQYDSERLSVDNAKHYLRRRIRCAMFDEIRLNSPTPRGLDDNHRRTKRAITNLEAQQQRPININNADDLELVATKLNRKQRDVLRSEHRYMMFNCQSIDSPTQTSQGNESGMTYGDSISDSTATQALDDIIFQTSTLNIAKMRVLALMSERDALVIERTLFGGFTQHEVALEVGLERSRISQIVSFFVAETKRFAILLEEDPDAELALNSRNSVNATKAV